MGIDQRVRLDMVKNGNYLIIGQSTPEDAGEYSCQISAFNPTELTHTVRIRTSPVITTTPEKALVAVAGSSVTLSCRVESGSPQPTLDWRREGEEKTLESHGGVLTIDKVTRHMVRELENEQCQKETPTRKYIKRCSCSNPIPPHFRMDCGS